MMLFPSTCFLSLDHRLDDDGYAIPAHFFVLGEEGKGTGGLDGVYTYTSHV